VDDRVRSTLKSVVAYVLLVGIPFAALAAILHAGSRLQAPPAIGGEWRLTESAGLSAPGAAPATLRIAQSGTHLSLVLAGREMRGTLRGDSVQATATGSRGASAGGCFQDGPAALRARVDASKPEARMVGEVAAAGCAPLPFAAVRDARGGR
jgi:hypothetical protein